MRSKGATQVFAMNEEPPPQARCETNSFADSIVIDPGSAFLFKFVFFPSDREIIWSLEKPTGKNPGCLTRFAYADHMTSLSPP